MKLKSAILVFLIAVIIFVGCSNNTTASKYVQFGDTEPETAGSVIYNVVSEENIRSENFYYNDVYSECRKEVCENVIDNFSGIDEAAYSEYEAFLDGKGVYVSKKAIYAYALNSVDNAYESDAEQILFSVPVFSEDMSSACRAEVTLHSDGSVSTCLSSGLLACAEDDIKSMPQKHFILLFGNRTDAAVWFYMVLSEDNEIYEWATRVNQDIRVEGDPYHALPYKDMAFSYNELTDKSNLIWMEF